MRSFLMVPRLVAIVVLFIAFAAANVRAQCNVPVQQQQVSTQQLLQQLSAIQASQTQAQAVAQPIAQPQFAIDPRFVSVERSTSVARTRPSLATSIEQLSAVATQFTGGKQLSPLQAPVQAPQVQVQAPAATFAQPAIVASPLRLSAPAVTSATATAGSPAVVASPILADPVSLSQVSAQPVQAVAVRGRGGCGIFGRRNSTSVSKSVAITRTRG